VNVLVSGFCITGFVLPVTVIASALAELSMNVVDWQVNKLVPDIAVSGAVGGVNVVVYTAVPLTTLKFEI
jgi:hypothetical protein